MRKIILIPLMAVLSAQVQALPADCAIKESNGDTRIAQPNGELLAAQCFQCHGYEGRSLGEIDSIVGKSMYGDLIDFKNNGKKDIMSLQMRQYTDCELNAIANYFSTLQN